MNKTRLQIAAAALVALAAGAAQAQVSVGASVHINVPGVYGRVDIGAPVAGVAFVPPPVVYEQPVIIAPAPVAVQQSPVYLYVPDAYQRDWRHHCAAYGACGRPVYFVREQWVHDRYIQHYPQDHRFDHWHGYERPAMVEHREMQREHHEMERERHEDRREERHDDHDHGHGHDDRDHGRDGDRR